MNKYNQSIPIKPYLEEILAQIESAEKSIASSGNIFDNIHHFLIHSTIVYKILFPYLDEKKIINNDNNELRKKMRKKSLQKYFDDFDTIKKDDIVKKFRDHFEHIDERIDSVVKQNFIFDKNISYSNKIENIIRIEGLNNESKMRNYENGCFTFYGASCDIEDVRKWLDEIKNYILKKGIPKEGCGQFTNNVFIN